MPFNFKVFVLFLLATITDEFYVPASNSSHSWLKYLVAGIYWAFLWAAADVAYSKGRKAQNGAL